VHTDAITRWLAERTTVAPPLTWRLLAGGRSNLTYELTDAAGHRWVLRRPPMAGVVGSAHDVVREFTIMAALSGHDVPLPVMVASCADPDVIGAPFFVMSFVEGITLPDRQSAERDLAPSRRPAVGPRMAAVLAAIHAVPTGLLGADRPGQGRRGTDYVRRQLVRWTEQLDRLGVRQSPAMRAVLRRLTEGVPGQREVTVVHGDFRLGNVILTRSGRIAAVLDWELATLGDPLADLGWLLAYWATEPLGAHDMPLPVPTLAEGFTPRDEVGRHYAAASGRSLADLDFYLGFAFWRLAAIYSGVQARVRSGGYPSGVAGAEDATDRVERLVEAASCALDAAGR
jgi:aminoglycoside phosphotransferase (APT) family kinase protein